LATTFTVDRTDFGVVLIHILSQNTFGEKKKEEEEGQQLTVEGVQKKKKNTNQMHCKRSK
jgi:hypothetical protein